MRPAPRWQRHLRVRLPLVRLAGAMVLGALLATLGAGRARAQFIDRVINPNVTGGSDDLGVTVTTRARPDYQAPTVRLGSFILSAGGSQAAGYDDNVTGFKPFRGSSVLETSGSVGARSDWSRNAVFASLSVDDQRYFDVPKESRTNWSAGLGGTLQLGRDLLNLTYSHQDQRLTSRGIDVPNLDRPINTTTDDVSAVYQAVFNRLTVQPGLEFTAYRYDNGSIGGVPFVEDIHDRDVLAPSVTARYNVAPLSDAVVVVQYSTAHYDRIQLGGQKLDYQDVTALGGYDISLGDLLRLVVLAGYEERTFSSAQLQTIRAPIGRVRLIWSPTGLTTVTGTLTRSITDTASEFTSSTTATAIRGNLRVDHELRRNVLLHAGAGIESDSYADQGGTTLLYNGNLGATWLWNRYAAMNASYTLQKRSTGSTGSVAVGTVGSSYLDMRYLLQLRLQF